MTFLVFVSLVSMVLTEMCQSVVYAVVTCEIKLFQNYFSLRRRPSEIILFQHVELTCLKLFQDYFRGLLQLENILQHVHCRCNDFEIILELLQRLK